MPELEIHEKHSLKNYGKKFTDLHKWMDFPVKGFKFKHRQFRHDPHTTPQEAKELFGEGADHACLDHIILDLDGEKTRIFRQKNTSSKSIVTTFRLPNELHQHLTEYCLFMDKEKSEAIRAFIKIGLIDLINRGLFERLEKTLEEENMILLTENLSRARRIRDNLTLIKERDGNGCRRCKTTTNLNIYHMDGNISNFDLKNLITLCDDCIKKLQKFMLKYASKEKFAAWFFS